MAISDFDQQMMNPENNTPSAAADSMSSAHLSDADYEQESPAALERSFPAFPDSGEFSFPTAPAFPSCLNCPVTAGYGQVRFLNAASNRLTVNISVDNITYAANSRFGTITSYDRIPDGFHTITVRSASGPRSILAQQTIPFSAGEKYTVVLVDSAQGGLNLIQVANTGCSNIGYNTGCYRAANMAYSGSNFDIMLYSHDALFRNVGFREVTAYKQAMAGSYQFYVTNSSQFTVIRELPVLVIGALINGTASNKPLVSYQLDISAGARYTSYLIGNPWDMNFRVLTVED